MSQVYCIVECLVTYQNGITENRRVSYLEISVSVALINTFSLLNYLHENLKNVRNIRVVDTLFFNTPEAYNRYMNSM